MAYSATSSILTTDPLRLDTQAFAAHVNRLGGDRARETREYVEEVVSGALRLGLDPVVFLAQWWLETDAGRSEPWQTGINPAGLGMENPGGYPKNKDAQRWKTGTDAAYAHLAHMVAYVSGRAWPDVWPDSWPEPLTADKRFVLALGEHGGEASELADLTNTWAIDDDYADKIADRANAIARDFGQGGYWPMALTIEQEIIPEANANRPGSKLNADPAKWITIHETANYSIGAGARMHSRFVRNGGGNEGVSFHLTVDDTLAIQMMPLDEVAYHAGDGCDNRTTDLGCFQSVAIETCVNADSVWEATKENLVQLCAAIIKGDKRLAFGLSKGHFSPNRLAQHNKWSGKNCPARMRGEGSWGNVTGRILTAAGEPTPTPPPDPLPELFPGIDIEVARRLFGAPKGEDGKTYQFDPNGPVSKAWLEDSEASGEWPALEEVWTYGDGRRYYVFEGGRAYLFSDGELRRLKA